MPRRQAGGSLSDRRIASQTAAATASFDPTLTATAPRTMPRPATSRQPETAAAATRTRPAGPGSRGGDPPGPPARRLRRRGPLGAGHDEHARGRSASRRLEHEVQVGAVRGGSPWLDEHDLVDVVRAQQLVECLARVGVDDPTVAGDPCRGERPPRALDDRCRTKAPPVVVRPQVESRGEHRHDDEHALHGARPALPQVVGEAGPGLCAREDDDRPLRPRPRKRPARPRYSRRGRSARLLRVPHVHAGVGARVHGPARASRSRCGGASATPRTCGAGIYGPSRRRGSRCRASARPRRRRSRRVIDSPGATSRKAMLGAIRAAWKSIECGSAPPFFSVICTLTSAPELLSSSAVPLREGAGVDAGLAGFPQTPSGRARRVARPRRAC